MAGRFLFHQHRETVVPGQRVRSAFDRLGQAPPIKVLGRKLALVIINSHIPYSISSAGWNQTTVPTYSTVRPSSPVMTMSS